MYDRNCGITCRGTRDCSVAEIRAPQHFQFAGYFLFLFLSGLLVCLATTLSGDNWFPEKVVLHMWYVESPGSGNYLRRDERASLNGLVVKTAI